MIASTLSWACLAFLPGTLSAPLFGINFGDSNGAATTPTSSDVISSLLRPAQFSRVAYCSSAAVSNFSCGAPCDSLGSGIEVLSVGGDDGLVPMYFIAHDPTSQSIVVAHQGTETSNILSILNDATFLPTQLNSTRFPNAGTGVEVHSGFQDTFERTADAVLSGVKSGLAAKSVTKVLVTGHSLGAAIATMDAILLKQDLDSSVTITTSVFGLPRGGNQAWADFVDSKLGTSLIHMTNQDDIVPSLPPRALGFQQPGGEIHKVSATNIVTCPGQDNSNCAEGVSVLQTSVNDHLGPYVQNVSFGKSNCPL